MKRLLPLVPLAALAACASAPTTAPHDGSIPDFVVLRVKSLPDATHLVEAKLVTLPDGAALPTDAAALGPDARVVAAPSLVANDGQTATVQVGETIRRPQGDDFAGYRLESTVTAVADGSADVALRFEIRAPVTEAGPSVVQAEIPATTIRVGDGQSMLIPTRVPGAAPR
jgi:hypothetical protein